jgi:nicotinate phosphoribosyltransferase
MMSDVLSIEEDSQEGEPLIRHVMASGQRIGGQPSLRDIRAHAGRELARMPAEGINATVPYPMQVSASLEQLAAAVDRRTG